MKNIELKYLASMALLTALAYLSLFFIRVPIMHNAPFLRLDIRDTFITLGGIFYGFRFAVIGAVIVALLQMISVSEYGFFGMLMNILSVSSFAGTATVVYRHSKGKDNINLIKALVAASVIMTTSMMLWNYLVAPLYMGVPQSAVAKLLLPVFLPFNIIKSGCNSVLIYIIYIALPNTKRMKSV